MTDLDQFYPTIYTHAIPWSLHTKAAIKKSLKNHKKPGTLGDQIDKSLQAMNDGQTHGIPIGPDTSLVAAEILLAAVDRELVALQGDRFSGFRYVDDYELAFQSLSAAEDTLVDLQRILASYELHMNPRKTRIVDLPMALDSPWTRDIKAISIHDKGHPKAQRNDLLSLFGRAFELAPVYPADSILRYALSTVQDLDVAPVGWRAFHNCVLGAAAADPSTLAVALGTLHKVSEAGSHSVPIGPLAEVLESIIATHAPKAQGSEVAWALWGALAWSVPLSADSARLLSRLEDDVVALLALDANEEGLFPMGALDLNPWAAIADQPDALQAEHWLLAYEANHKGWLPCTAVAKHQAFSAMSEAGVSFYNKKRNKPQFPIAGGSIPGGTMGSHYG